MEFAIWSFVFLILGFLFFTLKREKTNANYNDKRLLERYSEIKKLNPNVRYIQLRKWESEVEDVMRKHNLRNKAEVIKIYSVK